MAWIVCPVCSLKHSQRDDGRCPRCLESVARAATSAPEGVAAPAAEAAAPPRAAPVGTCQRCSAVRPTRQVSLHQNVGVLVMRFQQSLKGELCRPCIDANVARMTIITLFAGWWGVISFFVTPFFLFNNLMVWWGTRDFDRPADAPPSRGLAVGSLVLGLLSLPTFGGIGVGALLGMGLGLTAFVLARRRPERYAGQGLALAGFLASGLALVVGVAVLAWLTAASNPSARPPSATPGAAEFHAADARLLSYSGTEAFGNNARARELAQRFSGLMSRMQPLLFKGGSERGVSLTHNHFLTHVELREGKVCFLVHVPGMRNYRGEARGALLDMAWVCARQATQELRRDRDMRLGVGLRGVLLYGATAEGSGEGEPVKQVEVASPDRLHAYFTGAPWVEPASAPAGAPETEPAAR